MMRKHMIWLNIAMFLSKTVAYDADKLLRCGAAASSVHHSLGKGAIIGIAVGAGAVLVLILFLVYLALSLKRRAEDERKKNPFGKQFSTKF